jgi:Flp pilus assembly secretin CpaC
MRGQSRTPGQSRNQKASGGGASSVELSEDLSITADKSTNTLIIFGSKSDFQKIKALLDKLDVKRRQVLVEAMLLEVGIDDTKTTNVSWLASGGGKDGGFLASNNGNSITGLLANPAGIQDFAIAAASAGTLTLGGGDKAITLPTQTLLLNAVRANSNVNVLSAPTILTTDNEQAEIVVGSNVPFVTSAATNDQNLGNTFNNVERQDVGITLRLTPQISSGDSVTLKIFTEVSSVTSIDEKLGPTTSIRTSETSVITKDSQMIVIGGLMSDDLNESERGVPFLKDIPVLGHLFKNTTERRRRTNLLILITPRIIRDQFDARDTTIAARDQVSNDINAQEIYPDRSEVLHSKSIDKVSEANSYDGPMPSTIFEPQHAKEEPVAPKAEERSEAAALPHAQVEQSEGEVLEFKVEPKFAPHEEPKGHLDPAAAPGFVAGAAKTETLSTSSPKFIVLRVLGSQEELARLPFAGSVSTTEKGKSAQHEAFAAVTIPADSGAKASEYFKVGTRRHYLLGGSEEAAGSEITLIPVGVFSSEAEAKSFYPDLASRGWYTLSPYEMLSIGDGPWK